MSTRANVKLVTPFNGTAWLYKHHDGYPTHTGDILEFVFTNNDGLVNAVDTLIADHKFETTTEQHGDINWLYVIKVLKDEWTLEITEFHFDGEEKVQDARFSWTGSKSEVWTKYKVYESNCAIKEAKHRLDYYNNKYNEVCCG
tara:strand:+ start:782 stop:1210 length:429 start_codon:yes stop_codon:yes gene_type:complete